MKQLLESILGDPTEIVNDTTALTKVRQFVMNKKPVHIRQCDCLQKPLNIGDVVMVLYSISNNNHMIWYGYITGFAKNGQAIVAQGNDLHESKYYTWSLVKVENIDKLR